MPRPINQARAEARKQGHKRYAGPACTKGHNGTRYTSTGSCVACQQSSKVAWLQAARVMPTQDDLADFDLG